MTDDAQWLTAGRVGRPHGLDGSFYVTRPRAPLLADGASIHVGDDVDTEIVRRSGTDENPILRLACATSRDAILALRGRDLSVARSAAPELEADEWYAEDLKGCKVLDAVAGREVGVVLDLMALPSCEALVVDASGAELLVPLVSDCVRSVDIGARTIDIDLEFLGEMA